MIINTTVQIKYIFSKLESVIPRARLRKTSKEDMGKSLPDSFTIFSEPL
jgi:hypothetical protein